MKVLSDIYRQDSQLKGGAVIDANPVGELEQQQMLNKETREKEIADKKAAEQKERQIKLYQEQVDRCPQFGFLDIVKIRSGFYTGYIGKIYQGQGEWENPENQDESVFTSYKVVILDGYKDTREIRELEARHLEPASDLDKHNVDQANKIDG